MKISLFLSLLICLGCSSIKRSPSSVDSLLYIGDSQSEGYLGALVYEHLKNSIVELNVYGVGSSSPRHWGDERSSKNSKWLCKRSGRHNTKSGVSIKKIGCPDGKNSSVFSEVNKNIPDFVAFQFLGNSVGFNESYIEEKIKKLLSNLHPAQRCLFITSPPNFIDLDEKNKLRAQTQEYFIKAVGSRCKMVLGITSETLKSYSGQRENYLGDRIHLSKLGAQKFFEMIKPELP